MTGALSASVASPLLLAATLKAGRADRLEEATAVERERSGRMERSMLTGACSRRGGCVVVSASWDVGDGHLDRLPNNVRWVWAQSTASLATYINSHGGTRPR